MSKRKQKVKCKACQMIGWLHKRLNMPILRHELAAGAIVVSIEAAWRALIELDILGSLPKLAVIVIALIIGFKEE